MRLCAGKASAQFAPLSWLSATGRATNRQAGNLLGFHGYIVHGWSGNKMFNCDQCTKLDKAPIFAC